LNTQQKVKYAFLSTCFSNQTTYTVSAGSLHWRLFG